MLPEKSTLLGLPVSLSRSVDATLHVVRENLVSRTPCIISFINPYAFHLSLVDQAYANALWQFDMILADGIGVVKALRWLNGESIERQSFDATSLFHPVLKCLCTSGKSLCLVGGHPHVAQRALERIRSTYSDVQILGAKDGYGSFDEIVDWVLTRNPDVVLVGMGAPNQEGLLVRLRQAGFLGVGITCGGFLDQYAAEENYYPPIIDRLNLRWMYRLVKEPRRLGHRYLVQYQTFLFDVFAALVVKFRGKQQIYGSHLWFAKRYANRP